VINLATKKKTTEGETEAPVNPVVFRKAHILTFKRYANRRDLLKNLLKDDQEYTHDQIETLINEFKTKGKVN
jgi:hypothetical protein